eukprot:3666859-Amphidinium_carterae.2
MAMPNPPSGVESLTEQQSQNMRTTVEQWTATDRERTDDFTPADAAYNCTPSKKCACVGRWYMGSSCVTSAKD